MSNKFNKDFKRDIAYEILVFFIMLALLMLVLRFWPVLILMILGIFAAALRLLYRRTEKVEVVLPAPEEPAPKPETEKDLLRCAFSLIQMRITDEVVSVHPSARWQWYTPNPMANLERGDPITIILNGAGGYRKASVIICNLMFRSLEYETVEKTKEEYTQQSEDRSPETKESVGTVKSSFRDIPKPDSTENESINYGYLAFEWVDAHLFELNDRCNEAIGRGHRTLLIPEVELPSKESWPEICRELINNDFDDAVSREDGILVSLQQ